MVNSSVKGELQNQSPIEEPQQTSTDIPWKIEYTPGGGVWNVDKVGPVASKAVTASDTATDRGVDVIYKHLY